MNNLPTIQSLIERIAIVDRHGGKEDVPILTLWVLLHLQLQVENVSMYVGSLQENLQHIEEMLRENMK